MLIVTIVWNALKTFSKAPYYSDKAPYELKLRFPIVTSIIHIFPGAKHGQKHVQIWLGATNRSELLKFG